jgi:hypothetical protein
MAAENEFYLSDKNFQKILDFYSSDYLHIKKYFTK